MINININITFHFNKRVSRFAYTRDAFPKSGIPTMKNDRFYIYAEGCFVVFQTFL